MSLAILGAAVVVSGLFSGYFLSIVINGYGEEEE